MKVWIDMTNSPHVPFFRPLIRLLEERGHEVRVSARDFAQTLELLDAAGIVHDVVGPPHGGAGRGGQDPRHGLAPARAALVGRAAAVRPRALPRLARAPARGPVARRAVVLCLRLRVRALPAHARLPRRDPRHRSGRDPAGAARPTRREGREGAPLPGPEGGVLPLRVHARPRRARRCSASTRPACSPSSARHPRCRSTTATATRSSPTCSNGSVTIPPSRRSSSPHPGSARCDPRGGAAVARRPRARDRRAEPDRARRSRRLGGRDDEPRGGRARDARLDDVRRRLGAVDEALDRGRAAVGADRCRALVVAKKTTAGAVEQRDPELMLDLMLSAL